jgi:hypothetical protein
MNTVLYLLLIQGLIGAFDTFYFHEWKARLPARGIQAKSELSLHAVRDYLYAAIFCTIPWIAWHGICCAVFVCILAGEVVFTMWAFVVEATERKPIGDVYPAERVTHAIMGIIYGCVLACLAPILVRWWGQPTALATSSRAVQPWLSWTLTIMGAGVFLSGVRDLYAALGLPGGSWPWPRAGSLTTRS